MSFPKSPTVINIQLVARKQIVNNKKQELFVHKYNLSSFELDEDKYSECSSN